MVLSSTINSTALDHSTANVCWLTFGTSLISVAGYFEISQSQSPLMNVKDAYIFPEISKDVSRNQRLLLGTKVLQDEELWDVVTKSWSEMPLSTVARVYAGHHQIELTNLEHKGANQFISDSKGLHCGSRQCFQKNEGGDGVFLVPEHMEEVGTMQHQVLSQQ
jgi:hypothetical protein